MTKQIEEQPSSYKIERSFGPYFGEIMIPDNIFSPLVKMTDKIVKDKNAKSHGVHLAGRIKKELKIHKLDFEKAGVHSFMEKCVQFYVGSCLRNTLQSYENTEEFEKVFNSMILNTRINSAWIVSQYENEYNPAHNHTGCEISGVLYLKAPDLKGRRKIKNKDKRQDVDGDIEFIYSASSNREGDIIDSGKKNITPKEKLMVLFPSYLLHTVYPFVGKEERRCIAFNANYQILQKLKDGRVNWIAGSKDGIKIMENYYISGNEEKI